MDMPSMFAKPHPRDEAQYDYISDFTKRWADQWAKDWDSASEAKKAAILESVAKYISDGISRQYYGDQRLRTGDPLEVKFVEMKRSARGASMRSTIMLNSRDGIPSKEEALKIVAHEATHHAQYVIKRNLFPTSMTQEMWLLQSCLGTEHDIDSFGIKTTSNAYIRARSLFTQDLKLRHALYTLQFVERQARQEALKIADAVGINAQDEKRFFAEAIDIFKDRYNCQELSDEQIFAAMDNAQYCLFCGSYPEDLLSAAVLYDMAVMIKDQEMAIVWASNGYDTIKNLSNPETKATIMSTYGYEQALALDDPDMDYIDFERN